MPSFCSILIQIWSFFFDWCKTVNILQEKYLLHKNDRKLHFLNQKREGLDCETWNFSWRHKRSVVKKHLKIIFFTVQPFIVKMQFEIWKYLHSKLFLPKYLSCRLHNSVQLVHIFPAACFDWNWSYCKSSICSWPYSTRTQIYFKSETGKRIISKYFVWNNWDS